MVFVPSSAHAYPKSLCNASTGPHADAAYLFFWAMRNPDDVLVVHEEPPIQMLTYLREMLGFLPSFVELPFGPTRDIELRGIPGLIRDLAVLGARDCYALVPSMPTDGIFSLSRATNLPWYGPEPLDHGLGLSVCGVERRSPIKLFQSLVSVAGCAPPHARLFEGPSAFSLAEAYARTILSQDGGMHLVDLYQESTAMVPPHIRLTSLCELDHFLTCLFRTPLPRSRSWHYATQVLVVPRDSASVSELTVHLNAKADSRRPLWRIFSTVGRLRLLEQTSAHYHTVPHVRRAFTRIVHKCANIAELTEHSAGPITARIHLDLRHVPHASLISTEVGWSIEHLLLHMQTQHFSGLNFAGYSQIFGEPPTFREMLMQSSRAHDRVLAGWNGHRAVHMILAYTDQGAIHACFATHGGIVRDILCRFNRKVENK